MADIQKLNVNNTTYDISTTWEKVTGKPSTFTPSSHTHSYLPLSGGALTGVVTMRKSSASGDVIYWVETTNSNHFLGFGEGESGNRGIYDRSLGWVFKIDTSNNVTISGTASNAYNVPWSGVSGKPTTISGYGITDAYTSSTIDSKLSGYLPLSGGTMTGSIKFNYNSLPRKTLSYVCGIDAFGDGGEMGWMIDYDFVAQYAPTLTGTGASGTWGISISGNAATATNATNADTLDGFHISSVVHHQDTADADTVINGVAQYLGVDVNAYHIPFGGSELLSFGNEFYSAQLYISHYSNKVAIRGMNYGTWSNWHELAFLDSNVASATKLQTARTIWGQSFDGTGNIDGCLSLNYSSATRATGIEISSTNEGESSIGFRLNPYTRWVIGCWNNALNIWRENYGTVLSIPSTNNVLIGTTTDNGYKLQVNGSANATSLYENGTRVSLTGHTHTKSQITDFPSSMPASDVYAWAKASTKPTYTYSEVGAAAASHTHNTIVGSYTANGGQQNPNYFGVNKVGALMMNTTVNGNSQYKDWLFMDCYSGSDVGGGVAIGVNRQTLGLYIMRSEATRTSWSEKAEIIGTHNYTTYCASASHTHNYAGSSSAGGAATSVVVSDSNANSTYRMVWHSGNSLYSTDNIYCNPSTDYLYSKGFYQTSDERLKTFYDPIKIDLDKLSKLRKNYFKFNDKDKLEIGVSAQEVQSIYPEIVSTDDNGYLSVAYDKLSVIALAAIDELDNKYKKEINDLKDQLDAIKNILNEKGIV